MKQTQEQNEEIRPDSKTRRKKDMIGLQKLGQELTTLNKKQLAKLTLPDSLLTAIRETERIPNSNEAKRRHLQYIGRVMRDCDHESIQAQLDKMRTPDISQVRRAQSIERWGERLLEGGEEAINEFMAAHPVAERQTLRQIQRNYHNVANNDENETRVHRRKLLDYIKVFIE